ncbi:MAG: hypothetical protein OXI05_10735 [Bacteroidota bacterium]|nr:hypothetical protein [Bacteroidota bacterium]MDE2646294.1 hypothetical protein [Bacteroidota bacterium]
MVTEIPQPSTLALRSVSVVVTAESHNPSILNPDFLTAKGIVPDKWQAIEILTTQTFSLIRYSNGINWLVEPSRLMVAEDAGPELRDSYNIHQLVKTYLNVLPNVPYRSLGLNFQLAITEPHPRLRLKKRFGANWMSNEEWILEMTPSFKLKTEGAVCLINISPVVLQNSSEIRLDCNVHHENLSNSGELCDAIAKWSDRQAFVCSAITKLFEI